MTIQELNSRLLKLAEDARFDDALIFAAESTQDAMSERIFENQENIAGNKATSSDYSTKEIWVEPLTLPRNAGSAIGKRGTPIKTRYFAGGWADVKSQVGRPNYDLNGILKSDFNSALVKTNNLRIDLSLKKAENIGKGKGRNKVEGLNVKYGRTFGVNNTEREIFRDVLAFEVNKLARETINGTA
jgi:hypothetical protein